MGDIFGESDKSGVTCAASWAAADHKRSSALMMNRSKCDWRWILNRDVAQSDEEIRARHPLLHLVPVV